MGKKRHSKDRLFITVTEHQLEWGGKKPEAYKPITRVSINCCCLKFTPLQFPVCTPDGNVFDYENLYPFVKKYGRDPVSGSKIRAD
jgi:peptidyl-prolyl cis-trans isomerase-like 2